MQYGEGSVRDALDAFTNLLQQIASRRASDLEFDRRIEDRPRRVAGSRRFREGPF